MFTSLRKLRISLIQSGSTRKYLLYALGEIILVVAGILIALQINNWSEKNKVTKREHILLLEVYDALETDSIAIEESQKLFVYAAQFYENCFQVYNGTYPVDSLLYSSIMRRVNLSRPIVDINYPNLAIEVLSQDVKLKVLAYYQSLAIWRDFCEEYNDFIRNVLRPFLGEMEWQNYGAQYSNAIEPLNNEKLFNDLSNPKVQQILFEAEQRTKGPYNRLMESYGELKNAINLYLHPGKTINNF